MKCWAVLAFLGVLFLAGGHQARASHIAGGEMYYTTNGPGSSPGSMNYTITLRLFRQCNPPPVAGQMVAPLPASVIIAIYSTATSQVYNSFTVDSSKYQVISLQKVSPCIVDPPEVCYQVASYTFSTDLPNSPEGYIAAFQTCCRTTTIVNVVQPVLPGSGGSKGEGATFIVTIPGTNILGSTGVNNSPQFGLTDTVLVCQNRQFSLDFSAVDPDHDSLSYYFCSAFNRGAATDANSIIPSDPNTSSPYYNAVTYTTGFSGTAPLGPKASIDPVTGIISGIAPNAGAYVVSVCVNEWRNGVVINTDRKDFILLVTTCDYPDATLPTSTYNCDSNSVSFSNQTNSSTITSYWWSFGVAGQSGDTSTSATPTYRYADTGTYTVTLIVNKNQECTDTATMRVGVYPGFYPGFKAVFGCAGLPVDFTDTSSALYGKVDYWHWNFGDPASLVDTSLIADPTYQYPDTGTYTVTLYVGTSKGCLDTVTAPITLFTKPPLSVSRDTSLCYLDTLQIGATGSGSFSWSPNYYISNTAVDSPLVHPQVSTTYTVTLTYAPGCFNTDSVRINVVHQVSLTLSPDTLVCTGDSAYLRAAGNGTAYLWTPGGTLSDSTSADTYARPGSTTQYTITSSIGTCVPASGMITVTTAPYPTLLVSGDTSICYGDSVLLRVTGGNADQYFWFPDFALNDDNTADVEADPKNTLTYVVAGYGNGLCPKPVYDTLTVTVIPPIVPAITDDTAIVVGQPLQLQAGGGQLYSWSPATGLNNTGIDDPIAQLTDSITYLVKISTPQGCFALDSVHVTVFNTNPDIFVPSAFTPNGDGHNDLFKVEAVGIAHFTYFRIFNRWGQEVFWTSNVEVGWDGTSNGKPSEPGAYVWMASGVDYLGNTLSRKGTVTLIR
jgi:gliding motility-associated-like protein